MMIILNPNAGGGTASKKWARIKDDIFALVPRSTLHISRNCSEISRLIDEGITNGEHDFVAAGGDGTINAVLTGLMNRSLKNRTVPFCLGAIGLGSSNDFHKPFNRQREIRGISVMIDTRNAKPRDVGSLTFRSDGKSERSYFILNASIGVAAEANWYFNHGGGLFPLLKRAHTPSAIFYAALRTIFRYHNVEVSLRVDQEAMDHMMLSNLHILKVPHVSGSLRYNSNVRTNDGQFDAVLFFEMTRRELVRRFFELAGGSLRDSSRILSWTDHSLNVSAESPFAVEFDGEVVQTTSVRVALMPGCVKVCQ